MSVLIKIEWRQSFSRRKEADFAVQFINRNGRQTTQDISPYRIRDPQWVIAFWISGS
jgi:hypothetical protein